jgi:hypothetical protein
MASKTPSMNPSGSGMQVAKPVPPKAAPRAKPLATAQPTVAKAMPEGQQAMVAKSAQASQAPEGEEEADEPVSGGSRFLMFNAVPSWFVSMVVHAILLLILAVLTMPEQVKDLAKVLTIGKEDAVEEIEDFQLQEVTPLDVEAVSTDAVAVVASAVDVPVTEVTVASDLDSAAVMVELSDFGSQTAPKNDLLKAIGSLSGSGMDGRGAAARGQLVRQNGGSEGSEAAVAAALKWFAEHQNPDGSWSFDHRIGPCQGRCDHQGSLADGRNGATALALLPFLGAGQTHVEGTYKATVQRGLYFLINNGKVKNGGLSFEESGGSMYSHGLASIVVCEAYAMTHDKGLMMPAQGAINYIVYAQDPVGGGWRYAPRSPGDTSVVGWQLMALKSGHMAYLMVPPNTVKMSSNFLNVVQADSGAYYGYTGPGQGMATTAVGLLCRMYLGWKHDEPALERGVQFLSNKGPSKTNMYYNYYATQVMRHYEGETWDKWNGQIRDWLVDSQNKSGHTTGSWHIAGDHGSERGGRIYCTSMATMILEVYYRHMPIYGKAAATEDFPL